ncbi:cytidine deaminase [Sphaerochaeta sp. PS]|uniref:cytidine deaminase n=1 Tax=Sphaerochaeta sp. PS TaxID=3076336 RepID=UPI0028A469DF|nr:cytidine deaminase [Sphaerochaeta sp. PS]MDT4761382.1 cytidine deaminase [Sphaerochaeta sp. PS]
MINGILFDMDGVLIDSEPIILHAAISYFASLGLSVRKEDFTPFIGAGDRAFLCGVAEKYGLAIDFEQARDELFSLYEEYAMEVGPLHGVHRFIANAKKAGLKIAVATSGAPRKVEINLKSIGLSPSDFDLVVTGSMIKRNKPAPDIYQLAALSMGLPTQECLVMEDAINGIHAGKKAGCTVCALTTTFIPTELFEAGADLAVTSLDSFEDFSSVGMFNQQLESMIGEDDGKITYGAGRILPASGVMQTREQLLRLAIGEAYAKRKNAYAPYSQFKVGAALLSAATSRVYSGCNVENSSYGATICAERNAVLNAVATEGSLGIELLVVVSKDSPPAPPCAECLQVLAEFSRPETEIHLLDTVAAEQEGKGTHLVYTFGELLPYPFIFPSMRL